MIKPSQLCSGNRPERQTLDEPLHHLTACHRRIEERLDTLERVIPHWEARSEDALAAVRSAFRFFSTNGVWHTEDEERSIFPRMRDRLSPGELAYLADLERQHDAAEAAYAHLCRIVDAFQDPPSAAWIADYAAAAGTLARLYREHIASEDTRLAAIGARVLTAGQLRDISTEMKARRGLS
ncbi:MAG: hemerythrin domain-containing protein [Bryobacterales bacterium]|nr:hemerythrin domain-containing protein [Bryobacterales bacterium]